LDLFETDGFLHKIIEGKLRGKPARGRRRIQMLHVATGSSCCLVLRHVYFSMLLLDTPCRMFEFLLVVHCILSSGIIKETMNE